MGEGVRGGGQWCAGRGAGGIRISGEFALFRPAGIGNADLLQVIMTVRASRSKPCSSLIQQQTSRLLLSFEVFQLVN